MKRLFDFVTAAIGLIMLSPLLLIIAIMVCIKIGTPVLFKQRRPGLYGKTFQIYKYRTMMEKKDNKGNLLPDEMRLTPFGQFLRRTSLDELPELIMY